MYASDEVLMSLGYSIICLPSQNIIEFRDIIICSIEFQ